MDRRNFAGSVAASAAGLAIAGVSRAACSHDLAIVSARALIDGVWKPCDLGVNAGKIDAIAPAGTLTGAETIKGDGLYVSPGWVDIHVHCVDMKHGRVAGSPVSRLGVAHGVTAIADAGTAGYVNYDRLEQAAADYPETPVYSFLNIVGKGIRLQDFVRAEPGWENIGKMEELAARRPRIVGIKYRADSTVSPRKDRTYYVRKCREAGDALKKPVMIHIGSAPPDLKDILPHLKAGDLIVKIGGSTVLGMEDYMAALAGKRPGDTVEVVVKRNGQEVALKATLAALRSLRLREDVRRMRGIGSPQEKV